MKNFFQLEVFKDGKLIVDKMTPTILVSQVITQWSAPNLGYSFRLTFDGGIQASSDDLFKSDFGRKMVTTSLIDDLHQEVNSTNQ
jgi:hypothetical protein